jgi:hypothetical protein
MTSLKDSEGGIPHRLEKKLKALKIILFNAGTDGYTSFE